MKNYKPLLEAISWLSNDPITKVGCVMIYNDSIVSVGYNRMPSDIIETPEIWERPTKYKYVHHAEMVAFKNLIYSLESNNIENIVEYMENVEVYITHQPCLKCLRFLYSRGINKIYYYQDYENMSSKEKRDWQEVKKIGGDKITIIKLK